MSSNESSSHSNSIANSNPKAKRWFKKPSPFQNKASSSKREVAPPATDSIASSSNTSKITSNTTTTEPSSSTTMPSSAYASSTYTSTSTTTTLKPLLAGPPSSPPRSRSRVRSSKAWSKTKDFLSSLGEPPTAQYDREQMMKQGIGKEVKTDGSGAFGAVNYGPYGAGGTFNGRL